MCMQDSGNSEDLTAIRNVLETDFHLLAREIGGDYRLQSFAFLLN